MTTPDLDNLDRLYRAATPAPWWREQVPQHQGREGFLAQLIKYRWDDVPTWIAESSDRGEQSRKDFDCICELHNAFPALLAELRRLRAENAAWQRAIEVVQATTVPNVYLDTIKLLVAHHQREFMEEKIAAEPVKEQT